MSSAAGKEQKTKVMIVEDEAAVREMAARVLQRHRVLNLMTHVDPWHRPDLDHAPVRKPASSAPSA